MTQKPAEIYFENGDMTVHDAHRDGPWLIASRDEWDRTRWYPAERIKKVIRLPETGGDGQAEQEQATETESSETVAQPAETTQAADDDQPKDYWSEARQQTQKLLIEAGVDVSEVKVVHSDGKVQLKPDDVDNSEGSPWRQWTDSYFGDDLPGTINWGTYETDSGDEQYYPESFELSYEGIKTISDAMKVGVPA